MNLLWTLTESIYKKENENDLLEEIYKDHDKKKFASQIINPNANDISTQNKPLFNNAIDRVRDERRRRDPRDYHSKYDRYDNRYRPREPRDYDYRRYDDDRRRRDDNVRTMQVGDKKVVLKRRDRSRSRSRSDEKRERSRERNEIREDDKYEEQGHYQRQYYPQDRFNYADRGFYPVRRFASRGGRFGRFLKPPRFIDARR